MEIPIKIHSLYGAEGNGTIVFAASPGNIGLATKKHLVVNT